MMPSLASEAQVIQWQCNKNSCNILLQKPPWGVNYLPHCRFKGWHTYSTIARKGVRCSPRYCSSWNLYASSNDSL